MVNEHGFCLSTSVVQVLPAPDPDLDTSSVTGLFELAVDLMSLVLATSTTRAPLIHSVRYTQIGLTLDSRVSSLDALLAAAPLALMAQWQEHLLSLCATATSLAASPTDSSQRLASAKAVCSNLQNALTATAIKTGICSAMQADLSMLATTITDLASLLESCVPCATDLTESHGANDNISDRFTVSTAFSL